MTDPTPTAPARTRPWRLIALIVVVLLGIPTTYAIASPDPQPTTKQTCATLYTRGTTAYNDCLTLTLDTATASSAPSRSAAAKKTINVVEGFDPSPAYNGGGDGARLFCVADDGTYTSNAQARRSSSCPRPITCTPSPPTSKLQCLDHTETPINPPGDLCQRSTDYLCTATSSTTSPTTEQAPNLAPPSTGPDPGLITPAPAITLTASQPPPTPSPLTPSPSLSPASSPTPSPALSANDPLNQAIEHARTQNLRIWLETDLTTTWQAGPTHLKATADRLAQYAAQPGVAGVKIAYDLGIRGFTTTEQIQRFIDETSATLRAALPAGRQLAIDVTVPELGCGTNQPCQQALRTKYPLITLDRVENYVLSGSIDVVNVSNILSATDYQPWKIPLERALTQQWLRLRTRGWDTRVHLGAREIALAHRGATSTASKASAEAAVTARVDQPLNTGGARSVVLWTYRQTWDGATWRLTNTGPTPNHVWNTLIRRKSLGRLAITYNPHEPEKTITEDIHTIAQAATEVYLHAQ
ncbi:hypothetical protein [Streptosporangium sp. CA-115845]|uniref:hypothetical protein n=1 Tax=Streptosporangium sp. CA-115845 TaxID=3240071 RepID=UPI003D91209A